MKMALEVLNEHFSRGKVQEKCADLILMERRHVICAGESVCWKLYIKVNFKFISPSPLALLNCLDIFTILDPNAPQ
jgi:hypothetical protein